MQNGAVFSCEWGWDCSPQSNAKLHNCKRKGGGGSYSVKSSFIARGSEEHVQGCDMQVWEPPGVGS